MSLDRNIDLAKVDDSLAVPVRIAKFSIARKKIHVSLSYYAQRGEFMLSHSVGDSTFTSEPYSHDLKEQVIERYNEVVEQYISADLTK